jgi:hypothetical protein
MRDNPSEAASSPAASGARSRAGRFSAENKGCKPQQGRGGEPELLDHHVESAFLAAMAPIDALDVEGRGPEALADPYDFARRHEEEDGRRVDKSADQPGTRNAVDLGPLPRNPDCASLRVTGRQFACGYERQTFVHPGGMAAEKNLSRGCARVAQPGRCALAQLLASLADDNG